MASAKSGATSRWAGSRLDTQQRAHVVHVAGNALAYAGVLHLDGQWPPVFGGGAVHLADGGRGDGVKPNCAKRASQPSPRRPSALVHLPNGHGFGVRAQARRISPSSGGSNSPASIDSSCPTFMAAPRSCASWSATRRALAGVSSKSRALGRLPAPIGARLRPHASQPGRQGAHARHATPAAAGHGCCGAGRGSGGCGSWRSSMGSHRAQGQANAGGDGEAPAQRLWRYQAGSAARDARRRSCARCAANPR